MKAPTLALSLVSLSLLACCQRLDTGYAREWVQAPTAPSTLDLAGTWESTKPYMAGGWGSADLTQTGTRFHGTLGPFTLEGKVAGTKVYTLFLSGGRVYYTAILELDAKGDLVGQAIANALPDSPEAARAEHAPVHLVRVKR